MHVANWLHFFLNCALDIITHHCLSPHFANLSFSTSICSFCLFPLDTLLWKFSCWSLFGQFLFIAPIGKWQLEVQPCSERFWVRVLKTAVIVRLFLLSHKLLMNKWLALLDPRVALVFSEGLGCYNKISSLTSDFYPFLTQWTSCSRFTYGFIYTFKLEKQWNA